MAGNTQDTRSTTRSTLIMGERFMNSINSLSELGREFLRLPAPLKVDPLSKHFPSQLYGASPPHRATRGFVSLRRL